MDSGSGDRSASASPSNAPGSVRVRLVPKSKLDLPAYALILERGDDPELLKAGYTFELVLRFRQATTCQQQEEVLEALRWWASFSGVGARTRRGLGAVKVTSDDIELEPVTAEEVEARGGWMVTGQPASNATEAWEEGRRRTAMLPSRSRCRAQSRTRQASRTQPLAGAGHDPARDQQTRANACTTTSGRRLLPAGRLRAADRVPFQRQGRSGHG